MWDPISKRIILNFWIRLMLKKGIILKSKKSKLKKHFSNMLNMKIILFNSLIFSSKMEPSLPAVLEIQNYKINKRIIKVGEFLIFLWNFPLWNCFEFLSSGWINHLHLLLLRAKLLCIYFVSGIEKDASSIVSMII